MKSLNLKAITEILCLLLILPSCASGSLAGKSTDLMKGIQPAQQGSIQAPDERARKDINRFSSSLFVSEAENQGNIMISPASVYFALAMAMNGADQETKDKMLEVLAEKGVPADQVNKACRDWKATLAKTGSKTTLDIANAIWYHQDFLPAQAFLQSNADSFGADARKLDFRDSSAPETINQWISDATKGTIDQMIEAIDPAVVMYLINTVYFKSDWQTPFDKNQTQNQTFNTPKGPVETPFLHRIGDVAYFTGNGAQGVILPYDDGGFAYFALLPDGQVTPREWIAQQEADTLMETITGLLDRSSEYPTELALPKYTARFEDSLKDELTKLGMGIAFDPENADFSRMNESGEKNLYISEVKHKTYVRVDEKGTEASAATSVEVSVTSMPMFERKMVYDRPFIYGIMDTQTGLPLFVGILEDPVVR